MQNDCFLILMFLLHYLAEFFFPKKKNFIILELFDYPEIQFVQEGQDKYFFPCNLKSFFFFFCSTGV
jgi:hypothetical protein